MSASFATALSDAIREAGLTKAQFGVEMGVDRSLITLWTKGSRLPNSRNFARIIKRFPHLQGILDDPAA